MKAEERRQACDITSVPSLPTCSTYLRSSKRAAAMEISTFKDMFLAELQELVDVETQLADALLRMAGAASHPGLKRVLVYHRAETETQGAPLETILEKHGTDPAAHIDQAMQALIAAT